LNTGLRAARFSVVAHVDQDVIIRPGWTRALAAAFADPAVAAAQGWFVRDASSALCTRAREIDLEQRYRALKHGDTDHVCTGNTMYRADVLQWIGLFDESLALGYDNDVSYRLQEAGYRLRVERRARSHRRRHDDFAAYLREQYCVGYGRLELVHKHPWRFNGDCVSPAVMMWHPVLMAASIVMLLASGACAVFGWSWQPYFALSATLIGLLFLERVAASGRALSRFGDAASLTFPVLHLARDLVWVAAIAVWTKRWIAGPETLPSHSVGSAAQS
jgi:cellulose synthase/poly-beta-1,6-N-acetylglucosamine synthase-like glycosyltransferase